MTLKDQVRMYIADTYLFGDCSNLKDDESLSGGGYVDSTGVIELVAFIEANFGLRIEDEEIIPDNLDSVTRISHFIRSKKAGEDVPRLRVSIA